MSFGVDKPMDVFGDEWLDHTTKIQSAWVERVLPEDAVLIPGDISWAMRHEEARPDLDFLSALPGTKVLLRGNHDYWWGTRSKVTQWAGQTCRVLHNNAIALPDAGITVVGTRGWDLPSGTTSPDNQAIYQREIERLKLSLDAGKTIGLPLLAMLHFPPLPASERSTPISDLLEAYGVSICVYGHLHGFAHKSRVEGTVRGVRYQLVSADYLRFTPTLLPGLT